MKEDTKTKYSDHVLSWLATGVYAIDYENLRDNYQQTLADIQRHFRLRRKSEGDFIEIKERVGWIPKSQWSNND
jgi:hypothetical protein